MVNYNGLDYLKRSIQSVLSLTYPNYEFILIDNNSLDGSVDFVKGIEHVHLINSPRKGEKNFACNYAAERATGEYLLFLDNDIVLGNSDLLQSLIETHLSLPKVGCINLAYEDEGMEISKGYGNFFGFFFEKQIPPLNRDQILSLDRSVIGYPSGIGIFISANNWKLVGGYDDYLKFGGDDTDLGIKLWKLGFINYLYAGSIQLHIGLPERTNNLKYAKKFEDVFYAHLYTITKNYPTLRLWQTLLAYILFAFVKAVKQATNRKDLGPVRGFIIGFYRYLFSISHAVFMRNEFRKKHKIQDYLFLSIRPKKINR